jgi:hypothetical protein
MAVASRWEEVLDIQLEVSAFLTSETGHGFGANWFRLNYADPYLSPFIGGPTDTARQMADGRRWAESTGVGVFNAEPIYVDPDMMTVVEAAVAGFHSEPLVETDLITREGFLVLPRPLWMQPAVGAVLDDGSRDLGRRQNWTVAYWRANPAGITLSLFHNMDLPDDIDRAHAGEANALRRHTRYVPTHNTNWLFGEMHPGTGLRLGHEDAQVQMQAIWRLLNQTLAVRTKQRPPRAFLRRALRMKMPNEHVTIVRLRRPPQESEPGDPSVVHWSHRWVVGGHWRNQWYSSLALHRQIWISPYVKGPDDLPLIVNKARIFALVR